ncbi:MAG: methyltransferase domain-containing protein [Gammaproteobacteria bacterium]
MNNSPGGVEIDTSAAEFYDAVLVPEVFRPWAELMVQKAQVQQGMRTLDVACGTGVIARCAARLCGPQGRSSGLDIDPAMIQVARAATLREGLEIDYRLGSASELPFEAGSFDAALCLHGLQYFPDKALALAELRRVMRPGASLVAAVWTEMQTCAGNWAMITALERRGIDAKDMRKPFVLSDSKALHALVEQAAFERVTVEVVHRTVRFASAKAYVESVAQGAPSSRLALAKVAPTQWHDFLTEVEAQLAPWTTDARLEFPMACNVLVARR